jgi:hypothetical protein
MRIRSTGRFRGVPALTLLASVVFLSPLACSPATGPAPVEAASTTRTPVEPARTTRTPVEAVATAREEDERAVWRVLIDSARNGGDSIVLVQEHTVPVRGALPDSTDWRLRQVEGGFAYSAIADLHPVARTSIPLAPRLGALPGVRWMTDADRTHLFADGIEVAERRLRTQFPGARSFIGISRVGFDPERRHAAVAESMWCGGLCGEYRFRLLRRGPDGWKVVGTVVVMVS